MRIYIVAARRAMERDPARWLYCLRDLSDPILTPGISCYARDPDDIATDCALVTDYDDGVTVRMFSDRPDLLSEAASDPAVRNGTRFCFFCGLPDGLRSADRITAGGHALRREDSRRTLERYGLFGAQTEYRPAARLPAGVSVRTARREDSGLLGSLDPGVWGAFPSLFRERKTGEPLWLAFRNGDAAGYLWAADAGYGFFDIVNVFVRPDLRGRGLGKALVGRFVSGARLRGRRAWYGYAASPASAALARAAGFEELYGECVSLYADN